MAKIKFDGDWKALLFAHCEKMVAGFIVVVALLLVWTAMGKKGLPSGQLPDDIDSYTKLASNKISSAEWEQFLDKPKSEDLTHGSIMTQVAPKVYRTKKAFDPPITVYLPPRKDPRLYAVEDLHAQAGFGMLTLRGPKARRSRNREILNPKARPGEAEVRRLDLNGVGVAEDDVFRGARWVVLTGLVPTGEQEEEYLRVFEHAKAYDVRSDYPLYYGYYVQRSEVTEDGTVNWSPERLISPKVIRAEEKRWSTRAPPLVKKSFLHARLTYPLPPMLIRAWDASAVHPKIPLSGSEGSEGNTEPEVVAEDPEDEPSSGNLVDDIREGFDEEENAKRRRRLLLRNGGEPDDDEEVEREISNLKMFRFFDFDVEPGKQYRYRVKLVMRDVNYERLFPEEGKEDEGNARVEVRFLDRSVADRLQSTEELKRGLVYTEWSKPSTVVTIPYEERFFAGKVTQSRGKEPTTTILIKKFDIVTGDDASATMNLSRGSVVNTDSQSLVINPKQRTVESRDNYPINTDAILVDLSGGIRMAGKREKDSKMTQPGELLFRSASGRLMVRSEIADLSELRGYKVLDETRGLKSPSGGDNPLTGDSGGDAGSLID